MVRKGNFCYFLVPETVSPLHVRSKVCLAPFHVRSKFNIAPFYVQRKDCKFAPHLEESNADFALHMEASNADFAPHMERRNSFRDQQIAKIYISAIFFFKPPMFENLKDLCDLFRALKYFEGEYH